MLVDLSHIVEDGMITCKGLPAPLVCDYLSREASRKLYAPGTEFQRLVNAEGPMLLEHTSDL